MTRPLFDRVGFSRPQGVRDDAQKGTCVHWIMTATLAICIIIAATMISIGIARAGVVAPMDGAGLSAGLSAPITTVLLVISSLLASSGFAAIGVLLLASRTKRTRG